MAESIADEILIHVNPADKVSQEEDLPVYLKSFGHLVLDVGPNSNSEAEDSQPPAGALQTGYMTDDWCFSRGRKITPLPCLDENGDGILDECYDADDELRTNATDDTDHSTGAVCDFITNIIPKMMFVSGETAEPSIETTTLIEDITREQVLEIVRSLTPHI